MICYNHVIFRCVTSIRRSYVTQLLTQILSCIIVYLGEASYLEERNMRLFESFKEFR